MASSDNTYMSLAEETDDVQGFPALRSLELTDLSFAALRTQGFVSTERRGSKRIFKLRFRFSGKQQVRFLGDDAQKADAVRRELVRLQLQLRERRWLAELTRAGRRKLRIHKRMLEPLLQEASFHFHGQRIRQSRKSKAKNAEV